MAQIPATCHETLPNFNITNSCAKQTMATPGSVGLQKSMDCHKLHKNKKYT